MKSVRGSLPARVRIPALAGVLAGAAVALGVGLTALESDRASEATERLGLVRAASVLSESSDLTRVAREGRLPVVGRSGVGAVAIAGSASVIDALGAPCVARPVPAGARAVGPLALEGETWNGACVPIERGAIVLGEPAVDRQGALRRRALGFGFMVGTLAAALIIASVRRLTNPVAEISSAARRLARGERLVRVEVPEEPEVRPLAEALNQLAVAVEEREDEVQGRVALTRQIAALVAHEVRNPLHSLTLLADVLAYEPDADARREGLVAIQRELGLIEEVVRRLVDSGESLHLVRRDADLVQVVERSFQLQGPRARELSVTLHRAGVQAASAVIDGALARRAIENLIHNAVEICGAAGGGRVEVALAEAQGAWVIIVDDDGPGVPPGDRERIFEPGFSQREGGTGLGLHMARQVTLAHGGALSCSESPLGGARFTLTLPPEP